MRVGCGGVRCAACGGVAGLSSACQEQERPGEWACSLAVVARVVAVAVVFDGGRVDAAGRGALLGRRSGRGGVCAGGGGVSGVGARVVDVQGLSVVGRSYVFFGLAECSALRIFLVEL